MQNNINNPFGISDYQKYLNYLNSQNNINQTQVFENTQQQQYYTNLDNNVYENMNPNFVNNVYEINPSLQVNNQENNNNPTIVVEQKKENSKNRRLYVAFTIILWIISVFSLLLSIASVFIFYIAMLSVPLLNLCSLLHVLKTFIVPKKRVYSIIATILSILFIIINILGFVLLWIYLQSDGWAILTMTIYYNIFNLIILFIFHLYFIFQDTYILLKVDF
jgi:hypothetical protein